MTEHERYLFDLRGYLVVENALSPEEVQAANAALDQHWSQVKPRARESSLSGGSETLRGEKGRLEAGFNLLQLPKPWCEPFRQMLAHPRIVPYLHELIGTGFRLDHGPGLIAMEQGCEGHVLHGGSEPYDPSQFYVHKNGRMYNGLTVVSWQLTEVRPGDGGFCCIPGSHKGNVACPSDIKRWEAHRDCVVQVAAPAGSAVIFTEALTHGTLPWRGQAQRRSILYKMSPGFLAWGGAPTHAQEFLDELTPNQRAVLAPPYRPNRPVVEI
ncbi:MAG: phytanoyl-CoA dioxygenase family protein [Candidatus Latescibacteria bacterium]|nr:phytanoyl-CoA dioxygenase family protein [Candidatus Latescibacterota bacterium]